MWIFPGPDFIPGRIGEFTGISFGFLTEQRVDQRIAGLGPWQRGLFSGDLPRRGWRIVDHLDRAVALYLY